MELEVECPHCNYEWTEEFDKEDVIDWDDDDDDDDTSNEDEEESESMERECEECGTELELMDEETKANSKQERWRCPDCNKIVLRNIEYDSKGNVVGDVSYNVDENGNLLSEDEDDDDEGWED
jgi:DNA-directed RNA polymerase subunit RPC12/RpoP